MSSLSQFQAGGRPAKVEVLTGSGTWAPLFTPCWVRATIVGGGGGGARGSTTTSAGSGGGGGATVYGWLRIPSSGTVDYVVGAGGNGGTTESQNGTGGGYSRFGGITAPGGKGGSSAGTKTSNWGGHLSALLSGDSLLGGLPGVAGGSGGAQTEAGYAAGFPIATGTATHLVSGGAAQGATSTNKGGGGGGDSAYGIGGNGGNGSSGTASAGSAGTGYGAGGGGGGSGTTSGNGGGGSGGTIIIETYPTAE